MRPGGLATGRFLDAALALVAAGLAVVIVRDALAIESDRRPAAAVLAGDPLDLPALRDLGLALDRQGRFAEAEALMSFVGGRSWRDGPAEAWLLRRRLDEGRYGEAMAHADALLREDADGAARPVLFPLLVAAADAPRARPALVERLAARPWWRPDFLAALAAQGGPAGVRATLAALAQGPSPPTPAEYGPFVGRLVAAGDYLGAYAAWRAIARPRQGSSPPLEDGDFVGPADQTAFTWSAARGVGAASQVGPAPDGAEPRALRVDYDGFSSPSLPGQLLVDLPRTYAIRWRERLDPAVAGRLFWRVRCADSGAVIARGPFPGAGWGEAAMSVIAPAAGCAAQWLELAASPGERRAPGTGWYARFRLVSTAP